MNFNQNNQISVNTRYETFVSDTSTLTIGGWNRNLSIRITPAVGVDQNGNTMYDRNRSFQTALTKQNTFMLLDRYKKELKKYVDGEEILCGTEQKSVAVPVGRDDKRSIVAIEVVPSVDGDGKVDLFLSCYSNLDQNNVAIEANIYRHRFQPMPYIDNYNYQNGEGIVGEGYGSFNEFIKILEKSLDDIPFVHHSDKYEKAVSQAYSNSRGGNYGAQNNGGFNNFPNPQLAQANYNAPMSTSNGYQSTELPFLS